MIPILAGWIVLKRMKCFILIWIVIISRKKCPCQV
jgi:hypothetical protein